MVGRDGTLFVQGPELTPATVVDAWFIPDTPGTIRDSAAQPLTVWHGGFTLALRPGKAFRAEDELSGILSIRDRSGLETDVVLRAAAGTVPPQPPTMGLRRLLGLAFLGGLILNLMPCVFPVLALKVVGLAGAARGKARWQGVAYTAGVLVAFAGLGAALLAARAAGTAAGWGFQFQSPVFVAAMAWLLFAVGLNLSGVYELGTGLIRTGHGLAARPGQLGSFFTGLLAVVVATPCTAPFMGVAIAAGLAAPPAVTMLVFLAMGLGLAAPYAVLAAVPTLWRVGAEAGTLDGGAAPGTGLPDVWRERLAGVGGQPGGRPVRRAGHRGRPGAARLRRLGAGHHAGRRGSRPPRRAIGRRRGAAGGAGGAERDRDGAGRAVRVAEVRGGAVQCRRALPRCAPRDSRCSST